MMITIRAALVAALSLAVTGARAQDVTLTARDGSLQLRGTMQSYDGAFYRVMTDYGLLTLDAQGVICAGPGCPDLTAYVAEGVIAGDVPALSRLVPALVAGHAAAEGLAVAPDAGGAARLTLSEPATGRKVARLELRMADGAAADAADLPGADLVLSRRDRPGDRTGRVIALDAFVALVAPGNPLRHIALDDLAAVLRGEITDWGALGGAQGLPIQLHLLTVEGDAGLHLRDSLLGGAAPSLHAVQHDDAAALARAVAGDPLALGVGLLSDSAPARALPLRGTCGAVNRATPHALKSGDYPLPAPVFLQSAPRRLPLAVRRLLAFAESPAAEGAIRRAGLTGLAPGEIDIDAQGDRLAAAIAAAGADTGLPELQRLASLMGETRRLSVTFRFRDGAADLDTRSRGNLRDLVRAIEAGLLDGREVLLVGFSDATGPADANRALALRRAETVRAALLGAIDLPVGSIPPIAAESFGEALPITCEDTEAGRRTNRRVEVWLR